MSLQNQIDYAIKQERRRIIKALRGVDSDYLPLRIIKKIIRNESFSISKKKEATR